jgi:Xaa-Pro aminopeptidase
VHVLLPLLCRLIILAVIPSEDSHSSEYIASCDARRKFISGFSGSAGCAVVTHDKAALATDGRYFNQAQKQLDKSWLLLKQGLQDVPTWQEWAAEQAQDDKVVGVDPRVISAPEARKLSEKIKKSGGKELVAIEDNLVDIVWGSDRPPRPDNPVKLLEQKYAGKEISVKLDELRKELAKKKSSGFVVSMLDEIAWLFNLRGSDIPYNPVFFSYATVTSTTATLYINSSKLSLDAKKYLTDNGVSLRAYDRIFEDTEALGRSLDAQAADIGNSQAEAGQERADSTDSSIAPTGGKLEKSNLVSEAKMKKFLVSTKTSWALKQSLGGDAKVEEIRSPIGDAKAVKNDIELEGMRACHIRDGAALIEYFAWLERQLLTQEVDEVTAADKLEALRSKHKNFVGLSFDTISSTGANAAVIHYKPERGNCSVIDPRAIYLCDSGAQYLDGTTDTTRTLHFGKPTDMEVKAYTLVLKGNIALDTAVFPKGTSGFALDTLARQYLWVGSLED